MKSVHVAACVNQSIVYSIRSSRCALFICYSLTRLNINVSNVKPLNLCSFAYSCALSAITKIAVMWLDSVSIATNQSHIEHSLSLGRATLVLIKVLELVIALAMKNII